MENAEPEFSPMSFELHMRAASNFVHKVGISITEDPVNAGHHLLGRLVEMLMQAYRFAEQSIDSPQHRPRQVELLLNLVDQIRVQAAGLPGDFEQSEAGELLTEAEGAIADAKATGES